MVKTITSPSLLIISQQYKMGRGGGGGSSSLFSFQKFHVHKLCIEATLSLLIDHTTFSEEKQK